MLINCKQCNKEFEVWPSRIGQAKFCSAKCRSNYNKTLKVIIKCAYCKKEFQIYKHESSRKIYCSVSCKDKSHEKNKEYMCETCKKTFFSKPSRKNGEHIYCSKKCASVGLQNRETRKCFVCGKPIVRPKSHFTGNPVCSNECNSKLKEIQLLGEKHPAFHSDKMKCLVCGKEFFEPKSRVSAGKGKFCSKPCKYIYFKEHFAEENNPNWSGGSQNYRGPNWNEQRKRALIRDEFTCQSCGKQEKLAVHHKIRYAEFNGDWKSANRLTNLTTLCSSCHSRIENRQQILKNLKHKEIPC